MVQIRNVPVPGPKLTGTVTEMRWTNPHSWLHVDVKLVRKTRLLSLAEMRGVKALEGMRLLQRGNRLSITPVTGAEWRAVLKLLGFQEEIHVYVTRGELRTDHSFSLGGRRVVTRRDEIERRSEGAAQRPAVRAGLRAASPMQARQRDRRSNHGVAPST